MQIYIFRPRISSFAKVETASERERERESDEQKV